MSYRLCFGRSRLVLGDEGFMSSCSDGYRFSCEGESTTVIYRYRMSSNAELSECEIENSTPRSPKYAICGVRTVKCSSKETNSTVSDYFLCLICGHLTAGCISTMQMKRSASQGQKRATVEDSSAALRSSESVPVPPNRGGRVARSDVLGVARLR